MDWKCKICNDYEGTSKNGLATHLRLKHNISYPEYEILYIKKEKLPECPECGALPRYDKGKKRFMTYCVEHANIARSKWGKANIDKMYGGMGPGWKKGLTKEDHPGIKAQSEWMKENNPFYEMPEEKQKEARKKQAESHRIDRSIFHERNVAFMENYNLKIISPYSEYTKRSELLDFECLECGHIFPRTMGNMIQYEGNCPNCKPSGKSKAEEEIAQFLEQLGIKNIVRNARGIIPPKELDIYLPDYNFAIEYNGLYWHSEEYREKSFHQEKTDLCLEKGIKLFHIWSDFWEQKTDICKSMIKHALHRSRPLYPRDFELKTFNKNKDFREFFESNHLHGHGKNATIAFALVKDEEIHVCLSLLKTNDIATIERFAVKTHHHIPGAFSKLLKYAKIWCKENDIKEIKTYSYKDIAYSGLYEKNGFEHVHDTALSYFYTNGKERWSRQTFKATNELTEREVADKNNVFRVYGCGNKLWRMKLA